ncbi:MAG: ROK family protein [Alphaproteobacteria bacterium]|nr:ROK family protein [Alphaproteobacteria bacterium]
MARHGTRKHSSKRSGPDGAPSLGVLSHGAAQLPLVHIDTYNEELRDPEGFVGDRASNRAFNTIVEEWRERLRRVGRDPFGPEEQIKKKKLDKALTDGDPTEAGLVQSVIEEFAKEFATVVRRFLRNKGWSDTTCIVVGGGLRKSRVGEVAIGRAAALLNGDGCTVDLKPIRNHPDEAGLIGCALLAPPWVLKGHDAILAVDIGGSNIRAGVVALNLKAAPDLSKAEAHEIDVWCYGDQRKRPTRDQAVERLAKMLRSLISRATKAKLKLAPFVGIGCPGIIGADGSIEKGAQNLPGNWESKSFNLPQALHQIIPTIGGYDSTFILHNDAVVQGLSEAPFMCDVEHWGVMTIGTGLGNALFTSICPPQSGKSRKNGKKSSGKRK